MDTANRFLVCAQGDTLVLLRSPQRISKDEALNLAAWLVALADKSVDHESFKQLLDAVEST